MKNIYLILAHSEPRILSLLVQIIKSDTRNDVLVHIDGKVKGGLYKEMADAVTGWGGKITTSRIKVYWGDFSIVKAEMALYTEAVKIGYDYYHLISGVDFPIKPICTIGDFFQSHPNMQFFRCVSEETKHQARITFNTDYYHLTRISSIPILKTIWLKLHLSRGFLEIQKFLGIHRGLKDNFKIYKGDQWCSLSHDAVIYLLSKKKNIEQRFRWTCCPDEIYKQTILMNSHFRNSVYIPEQSLQNAALRLIDWTKGSPYVWTINDKEDIFLSNNFFARKFSTLIDPKILDILLNIQEFR